MTAAGQRPDRSRLGGLLLLFLLALGWGVNWTVMKVALREIPPWTFRSWSCLVAGSALLALARLGRGRLLPAGREWAWLVAAALFNIAVWHTIVAYALILIASSHAALLGYTMPLWVALISALVLRERLGPQIVVALLLGMTGIAVLISNRPEVIVESRGGSLLMIIGAISWAIGTIVLKQAQIGLGTLAVTGWQLLLGGVPLIVVALVVEPHGVPPLSATAWWAWAYMVVVGLIVCYVLWFRLVELLAPPVAALSSLLTPAVGVLSGVLLLGEPLGWREVVALSAILGALILTAMPRSPDLRAAADGRVDSL